MKIIHVQEFGSPSPTRHFWVDDVPSVQGVGAPKEHPVAVIWFEGGMAFGRWAGARRGSQPWRETLMNGMTEPFVAVVAAFVRESSSAG